MVTNISMTPYNLTQLQNANSIYGLFNFANEASGYVLMDFFLFAIWIVMILALMRYSFPKALVASTFVMLIVSTMFAFIGWCSYTIPLAFLGILACSSLVGVLAGSFRQ